MLKNLTKDADILNDNLVKVIWIIVIPIAITNTIDGIYGVIDSMFVSNLGPIVTASVGFVGPLQDTLTAIGTGLSIAGCSLVAKFIGAADMKNARKMIGQVLGIGTFLGFLVLLYTYVMAESILINADITPDLLETSIVYFRLTSFSVMFNFMILVFLAVERAKGNTKKAITINTISLVAKIFFSFLLTIVFDFGLVGISMATILAKGICALIAVKEILSNKNVEYIFSVKDYVFDFSLVKTLVIVAIPLIIEKSLVSYGFVLTNKYVIGYGPEVLAAYSLTNKVNSVFFKLVAAFGTGLSVIIAQNIGAKQYGRAMAAIKKSMGFGLLVGLICWLVVYPLRPWIADLFISDRSDPTWQHIINSLGVYAIAVIPWAITECTLGIFQGTGRTMYNLLISLVRIYVLRVPVIMVLCDPQWGLQEYGVWWAMLLSNIFAAIFSYILYLFKKKAIFGELQQNNDGNSHETITDSANDTENICDDDDLDTIEINENKIIDKNS